MAIGKRKRGRPPQDPEHGALSGKERKDRWRRKRKQEFRSAPLLIEGSGGLRFHLGQQGEREERREKERERFPLGWPGQERDVRLTHERKGVEKQDYGKDEAQAHEWGRSLSPEEGHAAYLPFEAWAAAKVDQEEVFDRLTRKEAKELQRLRESQGLPPPRRWGPEDARKARLVGQPVLWSGGRGRGKRRVHGISYQFTTIEDQVFQPGEVTEVWEAYRLDLVNRRPQLRPEPAYLQRIVMELEKGRRPFSEFPAWLKPVLNQGLRRLRQLGMLAVEFKKPNIWYHGKGRPKKYLVTVYSLEPEPRRKRDEERAG